MKSVQLRMAGHVGRLGQQIVERVDPKLRKGVREVNEITKKDNEEKTRDLTPGSTCIQDTE